MIRFERLRGSHKIFCTWVQYQIGTLTFIYIVSLSFLKTKFQNWVSQASLTFLSDIFKTDLIPIGGGINGEGSTALRLMGGSLASV